MITNINVWKVIPKHIILDKIKYYRREITNQLEVPIYDTSRLDSVFDTSKISFLSILRLLFYMKLIKRPTKYAAPLAPRATTISERSKNASKQATARPAPAVMALPVEEKTPGITIALSTA